jgi:hypothetical protein
LTYNSDDTPSHYKFIWESRLDAIEAEYKRLAATDPASLAIEEKPDLRKLAVSADKIIKSLDYRGAWVERIRLRFHNVEHKSGSINCQTFADNVRTLSQFLIANRGQRVKGPVTVDVTSRAGKIHYLSSKVVSGPQGDKPKSGPREGDKPKSGLREGEKFQSDLGEFRPQTDQEKALYEIVLQLQREVEQLRHEVNQLKTQRQRFEDVPGESRPKRDGDQPRRQTEREGTQLYPRDGEGGPRTSPHDEDKK